MKIETLKKSRWKIVVGVVVIVLIGATVILTTSKAKYRTTQSIPLVRGKINWKPSDLNLVAMYQEDENGEYKSIDNVPTSGYSLNKTESYCEVNKEKLESVTIEYKNSLVNFLGISQKGTKCYIYFDIQPPARDEILAGKTISERTDFSVVYTEETTNTVFKAQDNDGDSYYYAGAATDNYVSFAGKFWRIIRINGDGSIRLIYDGTSARANGTSSSATQIGTSKFNSTYNDNMYVGYMYTANQLRGLGTSSTIKEALDNWFGSNLIDYKSYLDYNAGFCGDRTAYTDYAGTTAGGGTGTTTTYYGAWIRLASKKAPSLKCSNNSDLYTVSTSSKGNKALTYPTGLISADEVAYAGGVMSSSNSSYYLYTGQWYWTMSPRDYSNYRAFAYGFVVNSDGELDDFDYSSVNYSYGVRPVINLRADVQLKSSTLGTMESPYVVIGAE